MNFAKTTTCILLLSVFAAVPVAAESFDESDGAFRSAYLGDRWAQSPLQKSEVDRQLKKHFDAVIQSLIDESQNSLRESILLLEATSKPHSIPDRESKIAELAAARATQIEHLKRYRDRGLFPENDSDASTPIFVDQSNTHCAVGYLMHCSGLDAAVQEVVDTDNLVCIDDVHEGAIIDWIKHSGLTKSEAMLIQPTYPPIGNEVTLQQFRDDPGFVYESVGLRVTDFEVSEFAFNFDGSDFEAASQFAFDNFDALSVPFVDPQAHDGMHVGDHVFDEGPTSDCRSFSVAPNAWASIWSFFRPLTEDINSYAIRVEYKIESTSSFIESINFLRRPLCGYAGATHGLARYEVRDEMGALVAEADFHAGWQNTTVNVGRRKATISYYIVVSYLDDPFESYYGISANIFHEFALTNEFPATELIRFRGVSVEGDLAEIQFSDDEYAKYNPGFTLQDAFERPVWLIFGGEVPDGQYDFVLEVNASTPGLERRVEIFNYDINQFEVVAVDAESFNVDSTFVYPLGPQNIDGENVRSRVGWGQTGFILQFPWEIRVDNAAWRRLD